jgi:hypothetical protein
MYFITTNLKFILFFLISSVFISNVFAHTWIDVDGLMDVSIEMTDEETITYHHKVTIRDFNNFEYFNYIYEKIQEEELDDENILQLRIGFEGENIATDLIFVNYFRAFEEDDYKVIELTTKNSLFTLNAFEYMLNAGARLKMSLSDNEKYFSVLLNKWHEYDSDAKEKINFE